MVFAWLLRPAGLGAQTARAAATVAVTATVIVPAHPVQVRDSVQALSRRASSARQESGLATIVVHRPRAGGAAVVTVEFLRN